MPAASDRGDRGEVVAAGIGVVKRQCTTRQQDGGAMSIRQLERAALASAAILVAAVLWYLIRWALGWL
jgi:hypothetical protein